MGVLYFASVFNKISGQNAFPEFGEVGRVGGIIAADDEQQIHRLFQHEAQGVLPILRSTADGVKKSKMIVHFLCAVFLLNGTFNSPLNFLGLPTHHGRLVSHPHGLEVLVGVEAFGVCVFKFI